LQTNLLTGNSIMEQVAIDMNSEIGVLEGVVIHTPGSEVENMTRIPSGKGKVMLLSQWHILIWVKSDQAASRNYFKTIAYFC